MFTAYNKLAKVGAPPPPAVDPFWGNVVLCMNMDDAGMTDAKGHSVTVTGVAQAGSGDMSHGVFTGSDTSYLSVADNADFTYGSGDICFEIDFEWQGIVDGGADGMMGQWGSTFILYFQSTGVTFYANGAVALLNGGPTWVANSRYHVAVQRVGNQWTLYVNGVSAHSVSNSLSLNDGAQNLIIGKNGDNNRNYHYGKIYGARITKAARYTANFTPPLTFPTA